MLDDGSPAPADVVIERVCDAIPRPETYTDPNGGFSFEVGGPTSGLVADASYAPGRIGFGATSGPDPVTGRVISSETSLFNCELRASLPGFRSDVVSLSDRGFFDYDVGTIVLHRLAEVQGYTVSATTGLAPPNAQKAYRNGIKRARNGNWEKAEAQLREAVEEYPRYAVAWQALGEVLEEQQRPAEAREAYEKAVEADSSYISPHLLIALLAARESDWEEMQTASSQVIRLNPFDFPQAYYFQSVARANLNDLAGAERSAREAIERDVQERYPDVVRLLGLVLAEQGEVAEAYEHLGRYLELMPDASDAEDIRDRLAEIDTLVEAQSRP